MSEPTQCICEKPYIAVGTKHCANCGGYPTEDTPTPNVNKTGHLVNVASANVNSQDATLKFIDDPKTIAKAAAGSMDRRAAVLYPQDDKQLRESLTRKIEWALKVAKEKGIDTTAQLVDTLEPLFTTAQIQLVSELEGHKHTVGVIDYKTGLRLDVDWIEAEVLEHKKQELEGSQ